MAGRVIYAGLRLLDRQMLDRDGKPCGNVDDLELSLSDDGVTLLVTGIYSGPGALLQRMGRRRLGGWLARSHQRVTDGRELSEIPFEHVRSLDGNHVTLGLAREELATFAAERWVRDHVIDHIPGARRAG